MSTLKCEVCGQGPHTGTTIHRMGEKGELKAPHWRCEFHLTKAIDPEVAEIVAVIESADRNPS